jgi:hypothetical protein
MASATKTFTTTHPRLLPAASLLVLIACSAVAARYHSVSDSVTSANHVLVETSDYLAWHRQETSALELDSLSRSLRLFSTIADKFASDASGAVEIAK